MYGQKLELDGDIEINPDTVYVLRHSAFKASSTSPREMLVFCHAGGSACDNAAQSYSVYLVQSYGKTILKRNFDFEV